MKFRRYQLKKEAVGVIHRHPWLFREQLSSAASVFRDGEWLRLYDGANQVVGHGVYEAEGAIAIRVLRTGAATVDASYLRGRLEAALARRAELAQQTDGLRLLNGESDQIAAVVADRFGDAIVVTSYSAGMDGVARYVARLLVAKAGDPVVGPAAHVVVRPVQRRHAAPPPLRVMRGAPPDVAHFTEDGLRYAVDLAGGHKTGAYLDLRALRRAVHAMPLGGARVLNLFSYTGMLGRAAEAAGAAEITNVDASERALAFAAAHHVTDPAKHHFIEADVFASLREQLTAGTHAFPPSIDRRATEAGGDASSGGGPRAGRRAEEGAYDLVIVDPPAMTSRKAQVPKVISAYHELYRAAAPHVKLGGTLVAACCTSRITRDAFARTVRSALGDEFGHQGDLPPEPDHAAAFPEADYLKIAIWKRLRQPATP